MDALSSITMGLGLGMIVVFVLNKFPGKPFAYEPNNPRDAPAPPRSCLRPPSSTESSSGSKEENHSAVQERIARLQRLLAIERLPVEKADNANDNDDPIAPGGRARFWFGLVSYGVVVALIAIVLKAAYGANLFELVAYFFPRETATLRQLGDVLSYWT